MHNKSSFLFLAILVVFSLVFPALGDVTTNLPTVAVVQFNNLSNSYLPNIENITCELLTTDLTATKQFTVVEREQIAQIAKEQNLLLTGRFEINDVASKLAHLLGADWLISGSILACDTDESVQNTYGIQSQIFTTSMLVSVKVWDVASGAILFSDQEEAEGRTVKIGWLTVEKGAEPASILQGICKYFAGEIAKIGQQWSGQTSAETIMIPISSIPSGADVEIDGLYVGSTPFTYPFEKGQVSTVRISLAGYQTWEKKIKAYSGLVIKVKLGETKK